MGEAVPEAAPSPGEGTDANSGRPNGSGPDAGKDEAGTDRATGHERPAADDLRRHLGAWARRVPFDRLLQLLVFLPVLVMVSLVRKSSDLQALDYWTIFPRVVSPTGSLEVGNLFHFHEGHVLAVPGTLYWLNWKLFDGLNRTLGVYVIGVVLTQVLVLRGLLPRPPRISQWWFSGLVVAFSVFVFAPQGAHHFGRAMSGTAWLTANLLSLIAIWLVHRRWTLSAIPFAALATVCYGTGLMAWPALVIVALLRSRWSWRVGVLIASAVVAVSWYAIAYERPNSQSSAAMEPNDVLHRTAQVLGTVVSGDPDIAVLAGVIGLVTVAVLIIAALRDRVDGTAPFIGLAAFACGGALLIGGARGGISGDSVGVSSRYASSSALLWCAIAALLVLVVGQKLWVAVGGLVVAVSCYTGGQAVLEDMQNFAIDQDALAVAIRMDAANGSTYFPFTGPPGMLENLGHYPYTSSFDTDCGLLGESLYSRRVEDLPATMSGSIDPELSASGRYPSPTVELTGWVVAPADTPVRCVVFADETGTVVGAGAYGLERSDLLRQIGSPDGDFHRGFRGPALGPAEDYQAYVMVDGSDVLYRVPGDVPGEAADPETDVPTADAAAD